MARFRYSGTNWEGRQWFLTAGGVILGKQVEARWPDPHPTDGTVASQGHDRNNPSSDHRPRPFGASPAVVRALDVGEVTEDDGIEFAELLREGRDPRIKYVLHEDRIFSSYSTSTRQPWTWAPLSIGHPSHVHVSFTDLADTDNSPWNLEAEMKPPSWAVPATQWHIDNGIYGESSPDDVDESAEFHRQSVFRHRFYQKVVAPGQGGGVTEAQVKDLIADSRIVPR